MRDHLNIACFLILAVGLCGSGCSSTSRHTSKRQYETVASDLHRDTDRARQLSAEGLKLMEEGKLDDAETTLKQALESDIMFGPAHNSLGMVYYHQQRYYLAAWEFEYACKLMPDRPEPRNNFGLVFEAAGKLNEAVDWYGKALLLAPDNAQMIGNLARAKIRRGDKDDQTRDLLEQLVMKDTRPDWRSWAQRQQTLLGPLSQPTTQPTN